MAPSDFSPHPLGTSPPPRSPRALLALAVVFVLLATGGWTTLRHPRETPALQASVAAWEEGRIAGRRLPSLAVGPARIARFLASLTESRRVSLAHRYPLAVGNMDGAPPSLRYLANRLALREAAEAERHRTRDARLSPAGRAQAERRLRRYTRLARPERSVLAFDPAGSGRVAEVFGDLGTAERVSVVVPGVDSDLLTYERTDRPHSAPAGMARALYRAERALAPDSRTAVIAWADYTAPRGLGVGAATGALAARGAPRLEELVRSLPGSAAVSLFCHSYGSVVCGVAAPDLPKRVGDIVVAGSPGMRAENASGLRTSARVWATRDADDWIESVPHLEVGGLGHGADPVSTAFGARVLSAEGADGHSGYFAPGTESLDNFARIGVGAYREVDCAPAARDCRAGLPSPSTAEPD
ncbi:MULTISPECIES: alpha/beta hydrolase [unclassified Streptomyces]|uniref:alpha/beta hydrolase n=1 Tax=unclassified Streptomyces TaxID=2593676 RepID=UPI001F5B0450|nr:alpha/beta hydrolase [Streptomyces sp. HSG2]